MKNKKSKFEIIDESLKKDSDVVSSTDMTGLMPAGSDNASAFKDIYPAMGNK